MVSGGLGAPAYKALIFNEQSVVSNAAAEALVELASKGLPLIFIGSAPTQAYPIEDQDKVNSTMVTVLSGPNIHHLNTSDQLPGLLHDLDTTPRVSMNCSSSPVYSVYRSANDADYIFFFNDQNADAECTATVSAEDVQAFELNAWTGDDTLTPASYTNTTLSLSLYFKANETRLFALREKSSSPCTVSPQTFHTTSQPPLNLTSWDLTIEDWHSAPDRFAVETEITNHTLLNVPLLPWNKLNATFQPVSGIGHYTTTFQVPEAVTTARLHLPLIQQTARVFLDGKWLGPIDPVNPQVLLRDLDAGVQYELRVDVTTTLLNRVKTDVKEIRMAGMVPEAAFVNTTYADYGLVGDFSVVWGVLQ